MGVVGAIVPWNWPFHNIINPISAAVFAGNAIVIKVSEHTSWSLGYYRRIMDAALDAAGGLMLLYRRNRLLNIICFLNIHKSTLIEQPQNLCGRRSQSAPRSAVMC